jgi:hypothetical protein
LCVLIAIGACCGTALIAAVFRHIFLLRTAALNQPRNFR